MPCIPLRAQAGAVAPKEHRVGPCAIRTSPIRPFRCQAPRRTVGNIRTFSSSGSSEYREQAKQLSRLLYSSPDTEQDKKEDEDPAVLRSLPLWRVQWSMVPGKQEVLHVHVPHYVHMFNGIFARPRPWFFGHLYLPDGSKHLGHPDYTLQPGSQAPTVGTLMEISRAVRLMDGKLLLLSSGIARFKVLNPIQETPFSVADVEILPDDEELLQLPDSCVEAALDSLTGLEHTPLAEVMLGLEAAKRSAAASFARQWWPYEFATAREQRWGEQVPKEGVDYHDTYFWAQELVDRGVQEVVPLPDGEVVGRWNLQEVKEQAAEAAAAAARRYLQQRLQASQQGQAASGRADSVLLGGSAGVGAVGDRGQGDLGGSATPAGAPPAAAAAGSSGGVGDASTGVADATAVEAAPEPSSTSSGGGSTGSSTSPATTVSSASSSSGQAGGAKRGGLEEMLELEELVWQELDAVAHLAMRVGKTRLDLPLGLLQLRPLPAHPCPPTEPTPRPSLSNTPRRSLAHPLSYSQQPPPPSGAPPTPAEPATPASTQAAAPAAVGPGGASHPESTIESEMAASASTTSSDVVSKDSLSDGRSTLVSGQVAGGAEEAAASSRGDAEEAAASSRGDSQEAAPSSSTGSSTSAAASEETRAADGSGSDASRSAAASASGSSSAGAGDSGAPRAGGSDDDAPQDVPQAGAEAVQQVGQEAVQESLHKYRYAASGGSEAHADPNYPPARRAQRLSYALAAISMEVTAGWGRQELLEVTSTAARLRVVLSMLQEQRKVLAATAAVQRLG